jgi:hypothetical protein
MGLQLNIGTMGDVRQQISCNELETSSQTATVSNQIFLGL